MKTLSAKLILFKLLFVCLLLSNYNASAQKTTIWLVRHAEKEAEPADDPGLTKQGQQRAKDLMQTLKHEKIFGVYVTPLKRTGLTAKPIIEKYILVPQVYNTTDYKGFANKVLHDYYGKNVLIVGHSNTIIPIIVAFGGSRPFSTLADDDYDMLFKLTLKNGSKPELEISYYGASHHISEIPEQYSADFNNHYTRPAGNF